VRRVVAPPGPAGARRQPAEGPAVGSRADHAYRQLRTWIMSARLAPGMPMSEVELAAELGISRTPVREAIRKLEQEGLVTRHPNRGVVVTQLSMREVLEIWSLREIIEPAAARLAAAAVDSAALDRIEAVSLGLLRKPPGPEAYELYHRSDLELHGLVLEACGNATLRQVVESLVGRIRQARMVTSPARFGPSIEEHLAIIAALKRRDPERAAEAMRRHLANAREALYLRS
jgi:DNA-binding GntR family transcriptional regulator